MFENIFGYFSNPFVAFFTISLNNLCDQEEILWKCSYFLLYQNMNDGSSANSIYSLKPKDESVLKDEFIC